MLKVFILTLLFTLKICECSEICKQNLPDRNLTVYVKWPYKLSCSKLFKNFSNLSECFISDGNKTYNESLVVDLRKIPDKPIKYNLTMTTGVSLCEDLTIVIQPQLISNLTPRQDALYHKDIKSNKYFYLSSHHQILGTINCINESSPFYFPVGRWKSKWYYTEISRNLTLYQTRPIEVVKYFQTTPTSLKVVDEVKQSVV